MFRVNSFATLCLLAVATSGLGQSSSPQQQFDAATAKFDAQEWRPAAEAYAQVRRSLSSSSAGASVAAIRQGHALSRVGEYRPAIDAVEAGLAELPDQAQYRSDRLLGRQTLATAYERTWDYLLAAENYRLVTGFTEIDEQSAKAAWLGLARTAMFDDPQIAYEAGTRALAAARDQTGQGIALNLMGRARMIEGKWQDAKEDLTRSLTAAGGLTRATDAEDFSIRADLAFVSLREGNEKAAHHFFASTGSGRGVTGNIPRPVTMSALTCHDGYLPNDLAIIEFNINRDGSVANARPVYASRLGGFGPELAQMISRFRWDARAVSSVSELQRSLVRLEVHCSQPSFDDGGLNELLDPRKGWMKQLGLRSGFADVRNESAKLPLLRSELARRIRTHGPEAIELVPLLHDIAASPLVPSKETSELLQRAKRIAQQAKTPFVVLAEYELRLRTLAGNDPKQVIAKLLAEPTFANDPSTAISLRYTLAKLTDHEVPFDEARKMYRQIADNPIVPATNPFRRAAHRYLIDSAKRGSDPGTMRELLKSAGATGNPCASAKVTLLKPPTSGNFPTIALRWGFEGWVMLEADISPKGNLVRQRPVFAYPPMVFTAAAQKVSLTGTYRVEDLLVPGQDCSGTIQQFAFKLPQ